MKRFLAFILASLVLLTEINWGQTVYYSQASGDPSITSNWNTNRSGGGSSPTNFTTNNQQYLIQNGHTMTTTGAWSISGGSGVKLQIENGGTLKSDFTVDLTTTGTFQIDAGGTYIHNNTGAASTTIFDGTESFNTTSTVEIQNWSSINSSLTTGVTLPFGNLNINWSSNIGDWQLGLSGSVNLCAGNFILTSTGTGTLRLGAGGGPTFTITGNFSISSGTLNFSSGAGNTSINIGGNFAMLGGTLTESSSGSGSINFAGSSTQTFTKSSGTISNTINFAVNNGATLSMSDQVLDGSGGTFNLNSGGTLMIGSTSGITSTGASGNIQVSGTRTFDTGAKYTYYGSAAQVTGNGLPASVHTLTINNSNGVTLTNGVNVTDYLTMTSGNITLNDQSMILGTAASAANKGSLTWNYGTSGYMVGGGSFTRWADTNEGGIFFPFGTATQRRSLQIYGTPTTGGTVSATYNDASGATSLSFTDNSMSFDKRSNLSWVIGIANGFAASGLTMTISPYSMPGVTNVSDLTLCISSGTAPGTYAVPFGSNDPVLDLDRTGLASGDIGGVTFYVGAKAASALPVELTSFTASNTENGVQLNWETATEVNNYGFNVERAVGNRQEAVGNWEKIAFIQGHGNSNSPKSYSFTDAAVTDGKVQYRLKQIDFDGKFEYSNIVEVNVEAPAKLVLYQNSPNPFNPTTEIKFALPKNGNVELSIYNMLGEKVETLANGMMNAGEHKVSFNASNLSSGVYLYKLVTDNNTSIKKMILLK